jgi:RNA polymerase sigma-70 factor (ECF subfamily)
MSDISDEELVSRCISGDLTAFDQLLVKYQKPLYNSCLRLVRDEEDAQDVVQTVFLKAYENLATFDTKRRFFSWIYKIMVNESLNQVARRKPQVVADELVVSNEPSPAEHYATGRQQKRLEDALMILKPESRAVVVLKYFANLSYVELGFVFDVPEKTVKSRLFDARRKLCGILTGEGVDKS